MRTLLLAAAILGSNLALVAFADCTTANVAGTYGYVGAGTVGVNQLGLPPGASSSVGTLAFDGKGNLLITETARIDNTFLPPDTTYPSTYTVDKQCVGTFTITGFASAGLPGPHFKVVFVDNRKGIRAISLIPGLVVNYVNTTRIESDKKQGEHNPNRDR
jgi:hypothetical protein